MIHLTRLGKRETFLLNPDLFERVDSHVDTVVRLTNGNEYVVSESAPEIIERIVMYRAHVLAAGFRLQDAGVSATYGQARAELGSGTDDHDNSTTTNTKDEQR